MIQNYNPYYNPYCQNPYANQQMQQIQAQQNYQPTMASQITPGMNGRFVRDFSEITANDVSMNGYSIFPKNDLSEIEARTWDANGNITTIRFKPLSEEKPINMPTSNLDSNLGQIIKSVDDLKSDIDTIMQMIKSMNTKTSRSVKKESDSE